MKNWDLSVIAGLALAALSASAAGAETVKACDVSVDYKTVPPDPAAAAAFQGVWVGSWDSVLCSALIVESIDASGKVQAWYIYGRSPQYQIPQAGKQHWTGKIVDKKLEFRGGRGGADYTLTSAGQLDGLYYGSAGQFKGTFAKK